MEQSIKIRLLKSIGKVYEQAKDCKLETEFFEKVENELKVLSEYFGTSHTQSLLLAMIFSHNYSGKEAKFEDLYKYFDCSPTKLLEISEDFVYLCENNLIIQKNVVYASVKIALANNVFIINEKVTEAILNNTPLPKLEDAAENIIEFLELIDEIGQQQDGNLRQANMVFKQIDRLINQNLHFPLIKMVHGFNFQHTMDAYLYLYVISKAINGSESELLERTADHICENSFMKMNIVQEIISGDNELIRNNLIEIIESNFNNDARIKLTEHSYKLLEECNLKYYIKRKVKQSDSIHPAKIIEKALYFNADETKQLEILKRLLLNENYIEIQNRLEQKGLPKGITVLLHGLPGTGKTETVFQFAKETNREIVKVDISQSKSMWFGESEKKIKQIFTNYKSYAKNCELKPILLFNEADAIIGKRKELGTSSIDQTENTIQNILLEELENFEGIFLATTNLIKNIDSAFDRRFLYKVEFHQPETSVKAKIWKSKLPTLTENECNTLASSFNFSGAQIENIIRKSEIYEIIHGIAVDFSNIVEFCSVELLGRKNIIKVGFKKA